MKEGYSPAPSYSRRACTSMIFWQIDSKEMPIERQVTKEVTLSVLHGQDETERESIPLKALRQTPAMPNEIPDEMSADRPCAKHQADESRASKIREAESAMPWLTSPAVRSMRRLRSGIFHIAPSASPMRRMMPSISGNSSSNAGRQLPQTISWPSATLLPRRAVDRHRGRDKIGR